MDGKAKNDGVKEQHGMKEERKGNER